MKQGDSAIFFCNFAASDRFAWGDEYLQADAKMERDCGSRMVGDVRIGAWQVRYGRTTVNRDICFVGVRA
ncbi:hypothetical protein BJ508DRAFT_415131 [Ascobolus immersus RN42]|uniref:Uncharacterized protein n=1 Tax=Ascobolus immersus RN42 TaxID=1160509 RepID=A0A3N4I616_ASCIM|nr:hypothetical protein BJ508DRAFT_415131 [Ascobolus immersus RN42]